MAVRREAIVGIATFALFFLATVALGAASGSATLRAFSFLAGIGGGGAMGVFAALFSHLVGRPAGYAPLVGDDSAWGLVEYDDERLS